MKANILSPCYDSFPDPTAEPTPKPSRKPTKKPSPEPTPEPTDGTSQYVLESSFSCLLIISELHVHVTESCEDTRYNSYVSQFHFCCLKLSFSSPEPTLEPTLAPSRKPTKKPSQSPTPAPTDGTSKGLLYSSLSSSFAYNLIH